MSQIRWRHSDSKVGQKTYSCLRYITYITRSHMEIDNLYIIYKHLICNYNKYR